MEELKIEIRPRKELSKNGIKSLHWQRAARYTRKSREDAHILTLEAVQERLPEGWELPLEQVEIFITQFYANRPLDFDGLAMKAAASIDGIVDAGVMPDDSPQCVVAYNLKHVKVPKQAENRIEIAVRRPWWER